MKQLLELNHQRIAIHGDIAMAEDVQFRETISIESRWPERFIKLLAKRRHFFGTCLQRAAELPSLLR